MPKAEPPPEPETKPEPTTELEPKAESEPETDPEPKAEPEPKAGPEPANEPPTADAAGPYQVDEGDTVKLDATGSVDPDGEIVGYAWTKKKRLDDATKARPVFKGTDDGKFAITLTVTDDQGASASADTTVKVRNVDPTIEKLEPQAVTLGEPVSLTVTFSDPGKRDTHALAIDWGDGTSATPALEQDRGAGAATVRHTYEQPGEYQVVVTVTDDDGGSASRKTSVVVTAPVAVETEDAEAS